MTRDIAASIAELKRIAKGEKTGAIIHQRTSGDNSTVRKYETPTEKVYTNGQMTFRFEKK